MDRARVLSTRSLPDVFQHLAGLQRSLETCGLNHVPDLEGRTEALLRNLLRAERTLGQLESEELLPSCRQLHTSIQERRVTSSTDRGSGFTANKGTVNISMRSQVSGLVYSVIVTTRHLINNVYTYIS